MREIVWNIVIEKRDGSKVIPLIEDASYDWDTTRTIVSGGSLRTRSEVGSLVGARLSLSIGSTKLGTFNITASKPHYVADGVSWDIEFMDDASRLERHRLIKPVAYAAMRPISATIKSRLAAVGLDATIADNDETLRTAKAWPAGSTTELTVINDLLNIVGFHSLWPSPFGLFTGKHQDPDKTSIAHTFSEGESSLHLPDYPQDSDFMSIPNRLFISAKGDSDETAIVAVAQDLARSQWSYEARGFWVDAEPLELDAVSQEALVAEADRRLKALQSAAITMTVQHLWLPDIKPGAVVAIEHSSPAVAGRWQVIASSFSTGVEALASSSLRKVH